MQIQTSYKPLFVLYLLMVAMPALVFAEDKEVRNYGALSVGDSVITPNGATGIIQKLFMSGAVVVQYINPDGSLGYQGLSGFKADDFTKEVMQLHGIRAGMSVVSPRGEGGKVMRIFANGQLVVQYINSDGTNGYLGLSGYALDQFKSNDLRTNCSKFKEDFKNDQEKANYFSKNSVRSFSKAEELFLKAKTLSDVHKAEDSDTLGADFQRQSSLWLRQARFIARGCNKSEGKSEIGSSHNVQESTVPIPK